MRDDFETDASASFIWFSGDGGGCGEGIIIDTIEAYDRGNGFGGGAFMRKTDDSNSSYNGEGYGHGYGCMSGEGTCAMPIDGLSLRSSCTIEDFIVWSTGRYLCE